MFTGIIEELGTLVGVDDLTTAARIAVRGPLMTADTRPGDSIAVDGVCLTVTAVDGDTFRADVMRETLARSGLGRLAVGDRVNLERAATLATRLGGHLVQGHVDGVATLRDRGPDPHWDVVRFSLPVELARYVVEKGSIAVDGVSLTVSGIGADWFEVSLIPTTLARTTLGRKEVGATVNLEVDLVAKYVAQSVARLLDGSLATSTAAPAVPLADASVEALAEGVGR